MINRRKSRRTPFNNCFQARASQEKNQRTAFVDERALAVFQPDVLVPVEYLATYQRKFRLEPEKVLMLAVLEDAVMCFQSNVSATQPKKAALYRDAEAWIFERGKKDLFAFETICDALGFDAAYLRQGLKRWKEARLGRPTGGDARRRQAG